MFAPQQYRQRVVGDIQHLCSKFHKLSSNIKFQKIGKDLTKFKESSKVGTFWRHTVDSAQITDTIKVKILEL